MRHSTITTHAHIDGNGNAALLIDSKCKNCIIRIFVASVIQIMQITNRIVEKDGLGMPLYKPWMNMCHAFLDYLIV